jgi:hypothetical protein
MTSSFLAAILPRTGLRCIVALGGVYPKQRFFETNEEAATFALAQDAKGLAVYHACATFKDKSSRKAENVEAVQSLWFEMDFGDPNDHFDDIGSAIRALGVFAREAGLPKPIVVFSGHGLHVYWPYSDNLSRGEWRRYALGLKEKCKVLGLSISPERVEDVASILRTIGTHNRKNSNETLVTWGGPQGPYPIEAFAELVKNNRILGEKPSYVPLADKNAFSSYRVETKPPSDPADANSIADRCAQMGAMRETRGKLPEPVWRSCLSVLKFCEGGVELAHEWSTGDPRYKAEETQAKLDKIQGPHKCETFRKNNPDGCKGCRFALEVSTPLELGRPPYTLASDLTSSILEEPLDETTPALPEGFRLDHTGLWFGSEGPQGELIKKIVSLTPFFLKRVVQTYNDQEGTHYVFEVRKPHEEVNERTIMASRASGAMAPGYMASTGIRISEAATFQKYLNEACSLLETRGRAEMIYRQFGWKDNDTAFLIGDRMYTATGVVATTGSDGSIRSRVRHFPLRGSLDAWTDAADMLCAPGCEAQQFAILASAAAPLMKFHSQDEGGAIYSESSRQSATGKSTSFDAAQSFWGDRDGLAISNTATSNARGIIMSTNCNLPIFFDEASMRDPKELLTFCQTFTDGQDRMRARQDGTLAQNPLTWQTVLLCGSNVPMLEMLGTTGGSNAMTTRILEVTPSLPAGLKGNGEQMRRQLKANSGQAGHRYLQYLVQSGTLDTLKTALSFNYDKLAVDFTREARFLVRLISAAKVAGNVIKHLGILHCDPQRMTEWAIDRAKDQLANSAQFAQVDALASYLNAYPNDILTTMMDGRKAGPLLHRPVRETRGRYETQTGMLYIAIPPFRKWLAQHDFSYNEVCNALKKDGTALETKLVTLTAGTGMPPCGQVQCLCLKSEVAGLSFDQVSGTNVVELRK